MNDDVPRPNQHPDHQLGQQLDTDSSLQSESTFFSTKNVFADVLIKDDAWLSEFDAGHYQDLCKTVLRTVLESALQKTDVKQNQSFEVCVLLTSNDEVQTLNKTYRNKDKPTNILSFPQSKVDVFTHPSNDSKDQHNPMPRYLGDLALAYSVILNESRDQKKPFDHHLKHLLVHGILHLLGFDHETDSEAEEMESLEIQILESSFSIKNPYKTNKNAEE